MATFLSSSFETYGGMDEATTIEMESNVDVSSESACPISAPLGSMWYDVFLSFRGEDTRENFTSFLYKELENAGVNVFLDSRELPESQKIHPTLMEAIEKSRISIPIFSKDYASSRSCLMEVEKIVECMGTMGQIVMPIFLDIEPSHVRNQKDTFEHSFLKHQEIGVDPQVLDNWKRALRKIGEVKGFTVSGDQAELVGQIVSRVLELLRTGDVSVPRDLVGMDQRVQAIAEMLQFSSSDVRIVGICGMPGIGKTTLAQLVYNRFHCLFQGYSFVSNIQERSGAEGLCSLQKQLIMELLKRNLVSLNSFQKNKTMIQNRFRKMRVLIVLDDIECESHIEAFAVSLDCFGPGSRIIITTRKPELLDEVKVVQRYTVQALKEPHAFKLFQSHAFGKQSPEGEYLRISAQIVHNTGGIPSIVKVVGSYLYKYRNTEKERWEEVLLQLSNCHHERLERLLSICYHCLTEREQQIYLDIACFLTGESKAVAHCMWRDCGFYSLKGMEKLLHMSLVEIGEKDELLMSNPVTEFGKNLVLKENTYHPEMRSRLWNHNQALSVLRGRKGTDKIQAMCLQFGSGSNECLTDEEFRRLLALRFLRVDRPIKGDFTNLLSELRWLDWKNCSDVPEEVENLHLEKLVILDMSCSDVTQNWRGWDSIEKADKLKVLVLTGCDGLHGSPMLSDRMQLQILNFEHCSQLRRISIPSSTATTLVYLNMKGCRNLNELPHQLGPLLALKELILDETSIRELRADDLGRNLEILSACNCKDLKVIDNSIGNLSSLLHLALDDAAIEELPISIGLLRKLQTLSLRNCRRLCSLPISVGSLTSLVKMDLSHTAIDELPPSVHGLKSLQLLLMEKTFLEEFPVAIAYLKHLKKIDFSLCRYMTGEIPDGIQRLSSLTTLMLSATELSSLPSDISQLSQLQVLDLHMCKKLSELPRLPTSLTSLKLGSHNMRSIPNLSYMTNLIQLHLADNDDDHVQLPTARRLPGAWPADSFQWIANLSRLETLELHISKVLELPANFDGLQNLRKLVLSCRHLKQLPRLPSGLTTLRLQYCKSMSTHENLSYLTCLSRLELIHCMVRSIDLRNIRELRLLEISDCSLLREIIGIEELSCLKKLTLSKCPSFQRQGLEILKGQGVEVEEYQLRPRVLDF